LTAFIQDCIENNFWFEKEDVLEHVSSKIFYQFIDLMIGAQLIEEDEIFKRWRFVS
jgi:hypothetical protein